MGWEGWGAKDREREKEKEDRQRGYLRAQGWCKLRAMREHTDTEILKSL